VTSQ